MSINTDPYILLAEDNPADVYLVKEALLQHGITCDVSVLIDGAEALSFIERIQSNSRTPCPEVVLLDLHLPKHDGEEILQRLRASKRCSQTPVIIMTASDSQEDHDTAERHAAVHYFTKPCNLDEFMKLGSIVHNVLAHRPEKLECVSP
jgi:CheY-like chemotaxis protein